MKFCYKFLWEQFSIGVISNSKQALRKLEFGQGLSFLVTEFLTTASAPSSSLWLHWVLISRLLTHMGVKQESVCSAWREPKAVNPWTRAGLPMCSPETVGTLEGPGRGRGKQSKEYQSIAGPLHLQEQCGSDREVMKSTSRSLREGAVVKLALLDVCLSVWPLCSGSQDFSALLGLGALSGSGCVDESLCEWFVVSSEFSSRYSTSFHTVWCQLHKV